MSLSKSEATSSTVERFRTECVASTAFSSRFESNSLTVQRFRAVSSWSRRNACRKCKRMRTYASARTNLLNRYVQYMYTCISVYMYIHTYLLTLSRLRLITLVDSQLLVSLQVASIGFFDCVFACVLAQRLWEALPTGQFCGHAVWRSFLPCRGSPERLLGASYCLLKLLGTFWCSLGDFCGTLGAIWAASGAPSGSLGRS